MDFGIEIMKVLNNYEGFYVDLREKEIHYAEGNLPRLITGDETLQAGARILSRRLQIIKADLV